MSNIHGLNTSKNTLFRNHIEKQPNILLNIIFRHWLYYRMENKDKKGLKETRKNQIKPSNILLEIK